jgi:hypothetical protein
VLSTLDQRKGKGQQTMPIRRMLDGLTPEEAERVTSAFAFALESLSLVDRNDTLCEYVARKVIELHASGIHDPQEIAMLAAKEFGVPNN